MGPIIYQVIRINGDYAELLSEDGVANTVAMALLPMEIEEGGKVLWENFTYTWIEE